MFTGLNNYDVEALCFSSHQVQITALKFEVSCYLGKFDLAKQMLDGEDFDLKEKITLDKLSEKIGGDGILYTFFPCSSDYLKLLVARETIIKAGFPVFTGHVGSNAIGFEVQSEKETSDSFNFILTSAKFKAAC